MERASVDALGLLCPLPILRAGQAMSRLHLGDELVLWSDDEQILRDLPAWCEKQRHELLALDGRPRPGGGAPAWRCLLRKGLG